MPPADRLRRKLTVRAHGTLAPNQADSGPAIACASPTSPKAMPTISIRSVSVGMRACCSLNEASRRFRSSIAPVSAPLRASIAGARAARKISTAIHT